MQQLSQGGNAYSRFSHLKKTYFYVHQAVWNRSPPATAPDTIYKIRD